jgi:SAM-dependent methyltransferase
MIGQDVRERYEAYYGSVELGEWRRLGAIDKAANVLELSRGLQVRSLLDVGCGDGALIARLVELRFAIAYHGVDISSSAIAIARAKAVRAAVFESFDGEVLPFAPGSFDLAVLSHVVEHLEHPRVLLRETRRVARRVIVEVPCEHTVRLPWDYTPDPVGHINFYTPKTIRRLVQSCGLTVRKQIVCDCSLAVMRLGRPWQGIWHHAIRQLALRLAPGAAPAFFVYHTALLCE